MHVLPIKLLVVHYFNMSSLPPTVHLYTNLVDTLLSALEKTKTDLWKAIEAALIKEHGNNCIYVVPNGATDLEADELLLELSKPDMFFVVTLNGTKYAFAVGMACYVNRYVGDLYMALKKATNNHHGRVDIGKSSSKYCIYSYYHPLVSGGVYFSKHVADEPPVQYEPSSEWEVYANAKDMILNRKMTDSTPACSTLSPAQMDTSAVLRPTDSDFMPISEAQT